MLVIALLGLSLVAERLVVFIPFEQEMRLARQWPDIDAEPSAKEVYLNKLMSRLTGHMELPDGMRITVHYDAGDTVNAYTTMGGHVVVYQGLIEKLKTENALAMVLAHEAAHIRQRHPIMSMGRGVVIGLALAALTGLGGDQLSSRLLGSVSMVTLMSFSREQEREADQLGLQALVAEYGHAGGAVEVYQTLMSQQSGLGEMTPEFLTTHPLGEHRIEDIGQHSREFGWPADGPLTPLDAILSTE